MGILIVSFGSESLRCVGSQTKTDQHHPRASPISWPACVDAASVQWFADARPKEVRKPGYSNASEIAMTYASLGEKPIKP